MSNLPVGFVEQKPQLALTRRQAVKRKLRARETVLGINPEFASSGLLREGFGGECSHLIQDMSIAAGS